MRVGERWVNGVAVIDVAGAITAAYPSPLKDLVCKLVRRGDAGIVVNLRDVAYIDSSGLGLLVSCYTRATRGEVTIVLANASPRVYELLAVTNLLTIFDIYDSEADALASFAVAA
jgi:anti-sigma B factor antagonist